MAFAAIFAWLAAAGGMDHGHLAGGRAGEFVNRFAVHRDHFSSGEFGGEFQMQEAVERAGKRPAVLVRRHSAW